MRFCDHGGAARFYKRGNCRGFCVKIVLEFFFGAGWIFDQRRAARLAAGDFTEDTENTEDAEREFSGFSFSVSFVFSVAEDLVTLLGWWALRDTARISTALDA